MFQDNEIFTLFIVMLSFAPETYGSYTITIPDKLQAQHSFVLHLNPKMQKENVVCFELLRIKYPNCCFSDSLIEPTNYGLQM